MTHRAMAFSVFVLVASALSAAPRAVTVRIDSPVNRAVITTPAVVVSGIVTAPSPNVHVTVNGVGAEIDFGHAGTSADPYRWTVSLTPPRGRAKLKARAFIPKEATPDDEGPASTRHVDFLPSASANFAVSATPTSGVAPLEVTFDLDVDTLGPITRFRADFDGNGTYEVDLPNVPQPVTFRYTTAGTRIVRFALTTAGGETRTGSVTVVVNSMDPVDAALREVWAGFSDALKAGDVATAMTFFADDQTREKYGPVLEIIRPSLSTFAAEVQLVGAVWITNRAAHYLLTRVESDGETHGYHLYFGRMPDGSWKIVRL